MAEQKIFEITERVSAAKRNHEPVYWQEETDLEMWKWLRQKAEAEGFRMSMAAPRRTVLTKCEDIGDGLRDVICYIRWRIRAVKRGAA